MPEYSLAEAAGFLGVSTDTIQRRLRKGELEGHKDTAGRWRVILADTPLPDHAPQRAAVAPHSLDNSERLKLELDHSKELVTELRSRVEEQARRMEGYEERAQRDAEERAELRRLLGNAQMQLQALLPAPAPQGSADEDEAASSEPVTISENHRRPWWKLWG